MELLKEEAAGIIRVKSCDPIAASCRASQVSKFLSENGACFAEEFWFRIFHILCDNWVRLKIQFVGSVDIQCLQFTHILHQKMIW